ncbi:hypothetical protein NQ315_003829 [Exocentrus adspersus]|uniref:Uncharacterized protein n=1 Tax=Exocentrus adspersus TaxID=1586481 RepID=A0AAV8VY01_9CUCU|nr:hypothetical protein NQ315_003829 [Exocentrus adspersus]
MCSKSGANFTLKPYCKEPRIHEILHIKCPIIGLIRFQMNNMEHRLSESVDICKRKQTWKYKLWKNRWTITSFILMVLLMVSLFLYGTLVGAGLCSASSWNPSYNAPCPKTFTFLPLINMASKTPRLTF